MKTGFFTGLLKVFILLIVAAASMVFIDFMIPGIFILFLVIAIDTIRIGMAKWQLSEHQRCLNEHNPKVTEPMARITYNSGFQREISNLTEDWKIDRDMQVWWKDHRINKWIVEKDVQHIEFFLHEFDFPNLRG